MSTHLTATLREIHRLTGAMGVAFLAAPTGDATALVTDILAPKTAYIATGKVVGTCTFDADTSDGTATEGDIRTGTSAYVDGVKLDGSLTPLDTSSATATASDILTGKTAYISDGTEATGTCDFNADTTDATAVENSLLYGHTAYGADGSKLTGTGAYWQKVMWLYGTFQGSNIAGDIEIYAPSAVLYREIFLNCTGLTGIKLTYSGSMGGTASSIFKGCVSLVTIDCELNCTSVTSLASAFQYCEALQTVRFTASSVGTNFSFANSPLLTTTTLLSIANGLKAGGAPKTLTMHADSKTNMDAINVDNVDGVAVLGSAMTLTAFVTGVKGWTIA